MGNIGLTFKDLAIFQGFEPNPADPDMWGWWDGDQYINTVDLVTIVGDASDNTVNKTANAGRNLASTLASYELACSTSDTTENLVGAANNWHTGYGWTKSGFTSATATTGAFTAQNGYARSAIGVRFLTAGATYTWKIKLKNLTGNTALVLYAGADTQNITIDGALQEYSMTFTAPVANFYVGVLDPNVAGFGNIEFADAQVYLTSGPSTLVLTTTRPRPHGVNGHRFLTIGYPGVNSALDHHSIGAGNGIGGPNTFYWTGRFVPFETGKMIFSLYGGTVYNYFCQTDGSGGTARIRLYTNPTTKSVWTTTGWIQDYHWYIFCAVCDDASSSIRIVDASDDRTFTGTLDAIDADGYFKWLGGDSFVGSAPQMDMTDFIGYYSVHDLGKQAAHIGYFKRKLGM